MVGWLPRHQPTITLAKAGDANPDHAANAAA
jgi:hypothetical protein